MDNSTPHQPKYFISSNPEVFTTENRNLVFGMVASTVVLAVICMFFWHHLTNTLEENYDRTTQAMTQAMGRAIGESSSHEWENSGGELHRFMQKMIAANPDVAYIEFQNEQGQVVYREEAQSRMNQTLLTEKVSPVHLGNDNSQPVIGTLHLGLTEVSKREISDNARMAVLMAFISGWVISIIAILIISWNLSKQLRSLVRGVKRLSTGDFGYRIPSSSLWGELKHLADSFNDMSTRLRVYEDQNIDTLTFERNKLEGILLSITDGVVVTDNDGEIVMMNDSACDMLDVQNRDVLIGTSMNDYSTDDNEPCFASVLKDFRHFLQDPESETFVRTLEFCSRSLRLIISPIKDTEGHLLGNVMIMHDITREMEIDKMKTQFISNVSHELRTPVTTIKSYVDTMVNHGNELDEETYREFMETINTEADRLKKMVNDILDFSRLEAPEFKMDMDHQDITPIINITVQSIKMLAEQKDLTIATNIESNLPKVYMNSDSIERVLRNLLSNAIKYTPDGGRIKVRAEVTSSGEDLEVTVEDTGMGIPEEHLDRIWDRFYRVENETHTIKGTGLGLHLVRVTIEDHHHGEVFVRSEINKGSVFGFRLPLYVSEKTENPGDRGDEGDGVYRKNLMQA